MLSPNKPLWPASKKKISFSQGHWTCRERTPHYQGSAYLYIEWSLWQGLLSTHADHSWSPRLIDFVLLGRALIRLLQDCVASETASVKFVEIVMKVSLCQVWWDCHDSEPLSGLLRLSWKWASVRFVEIVVKVSLCQVCWNCHKGESLLGLLRLS